MTTLALRPWVRDVPEQSALKDVLQRVNLERGHFRDITEASLQEEVAGQGPLELSDSNDDDDQDETEEQLNTAPSVPTTRKELFEAKNEMWQHVRTAEEQVLTALDFASLLLSKDSPAQGQQSMSSALKKNVNPGTLGADLWQRMPADKARESRDDLLGTAVRMEGLERSANDLLAAATRLEDNVRKETLYWEQVLSISEKGWIVCRVSRQSHRLAVTFGFSESAPEFTRRGIAALNADSDGLITLERGVGIKPKTLRVQMKVHDTVIGSSRLPNTSFDEVTTLDARLRHARDTLLDEELFHEMIRESRSLTSLGVSTIGSAICYKPHRRLQEDSAMVCFELLPAVDQEAEPESNTAENDAYSEALALLARLLLSQAHQQRLQKRTSVPQPLSENKEEMQTLHILRPIMSFLMHLSAVDQLRRYLAQLSQLLTAAKLEATISKPGFLLPDLAGVAAHGLIAKLMERWTSGAEVKACGPDGASLVLRFQVDTTLANNPGPVYQLHSPDGQSFEFSDVEDLRTAADASFASGLASTLAAVLGDGWICNRREALLVKDAGVGMESLSMWVSVDSSSGTLSLSTMTKKIVWSVSGESSEMDFWSAWRIIES